MAQTSRPLSPHLGIYRWQTTNTLSIVHRLTGVGLSVGAVAFTVWLTAIAAGPVAYARVMALARSPLGLLFLLGWTFCFFYHLCNGIRHLAWDAGWGFEIRTARVTGYTVVVAAVALTLLSWAIAMRAVAA